MKPRKREKIGRLCPYCPDDEEDKEYGILNKKIFLKHLLKSGRRYLHKGYYNKI